MIRISALNNSSSSDGSESKDQFKQSTTKEAKEAEAYSLYHKALSLLRNGEVEKAETTFTDLIQHVFIQEASRELEEEEDVAHPGLQLLYSIHKNMATLATQRHDYNAAILSYLEAIKIDTSEVTVWYKMGMAAMHIEDFQLAKLAFEQGLQCNPRHWPCLDNLITVLYSLNNYWNCLYYIAQAFEMDSRYSKGIALRNQMFKEMPCLRQDTIDLFQNCDKETVYDIQLDPEEAKEFVDEALAIRKRRQELSKAPEPPRLTFPSDIKSFSWKCVGEELLRMYEEALSASPQMSLNLRVTVPDYSSIPEPSSKNEERVNNITSTGEKQEAKVEPMETNAAVTMTATDCMATGVAMTTSVSSATVDTQSTSTAPVSITVTGTDSPNKETSKEINSNSLVTTADTCIPADKSTVVDMETTTEPADINTGLVPPPSDDLEDSDSVLEAMSTAHSLLDSLNESPPKADGKKHSPYTYRSPSSKVTTQSSSIDKTSNTVTQSTMSTVNQTTPKSSPTVSMATSGSSSFSPQPQMQKLFHTSSPSAYSQPVPWKSPLQGTIDSSDVPNPTLPTTQSPSSSAVSPVTTIQTSPRPTSSVHSPNLHQQISPKVCSPILSSHLLSPLPPVITTSPIQHSSVTSRTSVLAPRLPPLLMPGNMSLPSPVSLPRSSGGIMSTSSSPFPPQSPLNYSPSPLASPHILSPFGSHVSSPIPIYNSASQSPVIFHPNQDLGLGSASQTLRALAQPSTTLPQSPVTLPKPHMSHITMSTMSLLRQESKGFIPIATYTSASHQTVTLNSPSVQLSVSQGNIPVTQSLQEAVKQPATSVVSQGSYVAMDLEGKSPGGSKRGQKRRKVSLATEEIMMYGKRRSARVRNTSKKKEETINFYDLLQAFLPSSLKSTQEEEEGMDVECSVAESPPETQTIEKGTDKMATATVEPWEESSEVRRYLVSCVKNCGLMDMMMKYLLVLAQHSHYKWPSGVCDMYLQVYCLVRKHLCLPHEDDDPMYLQELGRICLVWGELQLDQWMNNRDKGSPKSQSPSQQSLLTEALPGHCMEDLGFLTELCICSDSMGDGWLEHCVRVYWMKARFFMLQSKIDSAIFCFERTLEYLTMAEEEESLTTVRLPNCIIDNIITNDNVKFQQESLQRCQSLEETQRLYTSGEYQKVVDFLLQTFTKPRHKKLVGLSVDIEERRSQLLLLQDALFELKDYAKCLYWGEESYNEAYQKYRKARTSAERLDWVTTMIQIFSAMQRVLEKDSSIVKTFPAPKLVRFAQNLVKMIDVNMSPSESVAEMTIDTVLPWILLYQLIKHEEDKLEAMRLKDSVSDDSAVLEAIPSSQMLLSIAHDYLGSRGWCTKSDGALLLFFMTVLKGKMNQETKYRDELREAYEQCVYCLFGHPNKKGRAKHLQDHNAPQITLTWEQTGGLFEYFKPKTLPEFDSYKSEAISGEVESLLKRMVQLVPENINMGVPVEEVHNYIEGVTSTPPTVPDTRKVTLPLLKEVYYLLADFHLKNSEPAKAVKLYIQDLCMNPVRLDSWAGMALARSSQLEQKLSSTELRMDAPIYKKSIAALRCFKRAVEIDETNSKLWIEYGSLAYQLHSHSSRQLAMVTWFPLGDELLQIAQDSRQEMLQIAYNCYGKASECEAEGVEEEWLLHYMMGKCLEKMKKPMDEYLQHYAKAANHLHDDHATYPKKIVYAYTTPRLAVEALEIYYRIHVCMLKKLLKCNPESPDINWNLYIRYIHESASSPFAKRSEKGYEKRDTASSGTDDSMSDFMSPVKKSKSYQVPSQDHTYVRQKSCSNSSSQSDTSASETLQSQTTTNQSVAMVTTMELHSEQTEADVVTLTTSEVPNRLIPSEASPKQGKNTVIGGDDVSSGIREVPVETVDKTVSEQDRNQGSGKRFSISSILGDDALQPKDNVSVINETPVSQPVQGQVKTELNEEKTKSETDTEGLQKIETNQQTNVTNIEISTPIKTELKEETQGEVKMDVSSPVKTEVSETKVLNDLSEAVASIAGEPLSGPQPTGQSEGQKPETSLIKEAPAGTIQTIEDIISAELKKPRQDLHRDLISRCKAALELCLSRFPTHYKSYYRLAYLYRHSPYHKSLERTRDVLMGVPKWQQLDYMPTQGLFTDRKQTNFFQGIWKIPIDEIDRSGSFPTHLNKCIRLLLDTLLDLKDSVALYQIHLQLNRSPESGKKYLRDAEKKCLARLSYEYTLTVIEQQIDIMKLEADSGVRIKFLMNVYKVWEHGVQKLGLHVSQVNGLFSEAYRVVVRRLEVLPPSLLLDQAQRFCKQQLAIPRGEKLGGGDAAKGPSVSSSETNQSDTAGLFTSPHRKTNAQKVISLSQINSQSANYSLLKGSQPKQITISNMSGDFLNSAQQNVNNNSVTVSGPDGTVFSDVSQTSVSGSQSQTSIPKPAPVSATPTVKIKMGLLQAAKMLKTQPKPSDQSKPSSSSDVRSTDASDSELESSELQTSHVSTEDSSSSSSLSSSSSSSSDSSNSSSDDDEEEEAKENLVNRTTVGKQMLNANQPHKSGDKEYSPTDDDYDEEEEYEEDDLDDKKDEDVIFLGSDTSSEEEFAPKGRAVIPSPLHYENKEDNSTVVLVTSIPSPVPILSSIMASAMMPIPVDRSTPVGRPIPSVQMNQPSVPSKLGTQHFPMEIESD